jgi:hypothetical protein
MRNVRFHLPPVAAALFLCGALVAPAAASSFSSSCDRFEVDGNGFGPADGTLDFVDEFTAGSLAPNWSLLLGTASETGGFLVVRDPGFSVQLASNTLEISTVENALHDIGNGEGNFTMNSFWSPSLPGQNAEFHMQLYSVSPIIEAAGVTVNNLGGGSYSVAQSLTQGFGASFTTLQANSQTISAADVTGEIVLRMTLDDSTDQLTCSFSLDGGATFQSPFPPLHVFNSGVADYDILLGAAVTTQTGPTPTPTPPSSESVALQTFSLQNPGAPEKRRLVWTVFDPSAGHASASDPTVSGGLFAATVGGVQQSFSLSAGLWRRTKDGFQYSDRFASASAVKSVVVRKTSKGLRIRLVAGGNVQPLDLVPPGSGGQADLELFAGALYCGSTQGGRVKASSGKRFAVVGAPAPAICPLP